jgi:hypothetical protein
LNIIRYIYDKYFRRSNEPLQRASKKDYKYEEYFPISGSSQETVDNVKPHNQIYNQGRLEACTGYAIAYVIEDVLRKYSGKIRINPLFNWFMAKAKHGYPLANKGVFARYACNSVCKDGIIRMSHWNNTSDYKEFPPQPILNVAKTFQQLYTAKKVGRWAYYNTTLSQADEILSNGYNILFTISLNKSFYGNTTGLIADCIPNGYWHRMVLVGYTYIEGVKHYKVANSWGRRFGDKGYCYIPESYMKKSGREYYVIREKVSR